ncbi:MAG TPA: hypothetical protein ENK62_08335 [Chromatiales bacterium]|nr:hypothetical protein [Chromatiales bacterium]
MPRLDRYQDPELVDRLAAEYVLGTLRGLARARFEALCNQRSYIRAAVEAWERRLAPLAGRAGAVAPPARVWRQIEAELANEQALIERAGRRRWWQQVLAWRLATAFSVLLAVGLIAYGARKFEAVVHEAPEYVVVLENESRAPMAVVAGMRNPMRIAVNLRDEVPMPKDRVMVLWCLMADTEPVPMAVLDRREKVIPLDQEEWNAMERAQGFAVSLEPPEHPMQKKAPEGPVVYQGKLIEL